ncbi:hypothetical protein CDAR_493741 [Caerostris darwini]|uniref:Uncharacterized protein n=1 Tax=Caerostris darwini TaxID=1538125 RepID=A0AAV4VTZ5_9ARAC|nr:hypothetical protein CDAR_493741 [Caerostris darwini]
MWNVRVSSAGKRALTAEGRDPDLRTVQHVCESAGGNQKNRNDWGVSRKKADDFASGPEGQRWSPWPTSKGRCSFLESAVVDQLTEW